MSTDTDVGQHDIKLHQGATYSRLFTIYSDAAQTTPLDMTGYTFAAQVRSKSGDDTLIATLTITDTDLPNGEITIGLAKTATAALTAFKAKWDLIATDSGGTATKFIEGYVELEGSITV